MNRKIINLTQHAATAEQRDAGVFDLAGQDMDTEKLKAALDDPKLVTALILDYKFGGDVRGSTDDVITSLRAIKKLRNALREPDPCKLFGRILRSLYDAQDE